MHKVKVAQRFQLFKGKEDVRLAPADDRGVDLRSEADVAGDAASPLGHAVHLAFLHIMAGAHHHRRDNIAGKDDPLAPDPDD